MPDTSLPEQKNVPHRVADSQHTLSIIQRKDDPALRHIGAQFQDQDLSPDLAHIADNIESEKGRHQHHQVPRHRVETFPGNFQAPRWSNLSPMERYLLELPTQQPAAFVEPSTGQLSTRRRCLRRPS